MLKLIFALSLFFHLYNSEFLPTDLPNYILSELKSNLETLTHNLRKDDHYERAPFLPPLPEVLEFDMLNLNLSMGSISLSNGSLYGLSLLQDQLELDWSDENLTSFRLSVNASMEYVSSNGYYDVDLMFELMPGLVIPITGAGEYYLNFTNFVLSLEVVMLPDVESGRINITGVILSLNDEGLYFWAENLHINGQPADWEDPNAQKDIASLLNAAWGKLKPTAGVMVQDLLNGILERCTLSDIIGGDLTCDGEAVLPTTTESGDTAGGSSFIKESPILAILIVFTFINV